MPDYRTESQKLSEKIREEILAGTIAPGEKLPQRKLAVRYGSTTIVARDALRNLENDGLVVIEPKWGAMVVEFTPENLWGRYVIREALEGMAARLACERMTASGKKELLALASSCDKNLVRDSVPAAEKANLHYRLHERIAAITGCAELVAALRKINLHTIILSNAYHIDWHGEIPKWHSKLIEDIVCGKGDRAESAMRKHVQRGFKMESRAMDRKGRG